jgi:phosphoribosylglycinamide formyltransferase-1
VRTPIAILASGRGSNFDAIYAAVKSGSLDAEIVAVVSDKADAAVLEKAKKAGLKAIAVPFVKGTARQDHETKILAELDQTRPKFLVLAGYMRIMTPHLIERFRSERGYSRIVNIHPSLLPAFPGVESYAQAFHAGVKVCGVTVHFVETEVDSGPICAQEAFRIDDCRSVSEVEQRGLAVEHRLYSETLKWVLPEKFEITKFENAKFEMSGRFSVRPN